MQKLNAAFEGAFRKIGLRKTHGKGLREVSFLVKALSLAGMPVSDIKKEDSKRAVAELVRMWDKEQAVNVVLTISAKRGIKIKDKKGNLLSSYKMYDIANCTIHNEFPEIFVFTAKHSGSIFCHAFYCFDITQAEAICLAMSDAFQAAFEAWMKHTEQKKLKEKKQDDERTEVLNNQKTERKVSRDENENLKQSKLVKNRRPSTMSNTSAFSFNSQADEVFQSLICVEEEEENLDAVLLRRGSINWEEVEKDDNVQKLVLGEEIEWDNQTEC